jgi:hypothetical protein
MDNRAKHRKEAVENEGAEDEAPCFFCKAPVTNKDKGITCAVSVVRICDTSVTCSRTF